MEAPVITRFLKRQDIDTARYNRCIDISHNSLIYAYTFYLDAMVGDWDVIIGGDYEYVLPLVSRNKWGVNYLYQPTFVQQLGVFSASQITVDIMALMLKTIEPHFSFAEINLNYGNKVLSEVFNPPGVADGSPPAVNAMFSVAKTSVKARQNFVLPLNDPYNKLEGRYTKDLKNNLRLCSNTGLRYTADAGLDECNKNFRQEYGSRLPQITGEEYTNFTKLCRNAGGDFTLVLRAARDDESTMQASALLLLKNKRMYLLQSYVSPSGRKAKANHFLLDNVIREFAGRDLIMDFEGSDVPGIADFYQNFGAADQPYFFYRFDDLPLLYRKFKNLKDVFSVK